MANIQHITDAIEQALRNGDDVTLQTLRMLSAQLHNREIEKRAKGGDGTLTDDDVLETITREVKKRREAVELFMKGSRSDLAAKEEAEAAILSRYLPKQLSQEEIEKIITEAFNVTGARTEKDFGKIMGVVTKQIKGRADAKQVSERIKQKLTSFTE